MSELYDCVRYHRQQVSVSRSTTRRLGSLSHVEEFADKVKYLNKNT